MSWDQAPGVPANITVWDSPVAFEELRSTELVAVDDHRLQQPITHTRALGLPPPFPVLLASAKIVGVCLGRWGWLLGMLLVLGSCGDGGSASSGGRVETAPTTSSAEPQVEECSGESVDLAQSRAPAVAGDEGFDYHQIAELDLDGDQIEETAHLLASVEKTEAHGYLWEDGHEWHLYIEEPDGQRTSIFSGWVQFGTLDVHVVEAADGEIGLALQHDSANYFALYCARYLGPGEIRSVRVADYTPSPQHFSRAE